MDENKDGQVTKEELQNLFLKLGEDAENEKINEIIRLAEENGDGMIEFEEFVNAVTQGKYEHEISLRHELDSSEHPKQPVLNNKIYISCCSKFKLYAM